MSSLWAPLVLFVVGTIVRLGDSRLSRAKLALTHVASLTLLVGLWPNPILTSFGDRSLRAWAGDDPLSRFAMFALVLSIVLSTLALSRRGSSGALSSVLLASSALGVGIAARDLFWFFISIASARAVLAWEARARASEAWPRASVLSPRAWIALGASVLAVVLLGSGVSTRLEGLALAASSSASPPTSVWGVTFAVVAVALVFFDLNDAAWRLPIGLAACGAISFGGALACCAILLRTAGWLSELSVFSTAVWLLTIFGALAAFLAAVGVRFVRGPRPFLSRLALAHAGIAAMSVSAGVSGRVSSLLLVVAVYAAILVASFAWDLLGRDDSHRTFPVEVRGGPALWFLVAALFALASVPPFPVFLAKLAAVDALLAQGSQLSAWLVLVSSVFVAVSCLLAGLQVAGSPREPEAYPGVKGRPRSVLARGLGFLAVAVAVAASAGIGGLPDALMDLAAVAVAGFF